MRRRVQRNGFKGRLVLSQPSKENWNTGREVAEGPFPLRLGRFRCPGSKGLVGLRVASRHLELARTGTISLARRAREFANPVAGAQLLSGLSGRPRIACSISGETTAMPNALL